MRQKLLSAFFSFSGASIMIGAAGFVSALTGMFIDLNANVSVKWLIFTVWLAISVLAVFGKVIHDLFIQERPPAHFENPMKFLEKDDVFLIHRNSAFSDSIVVGCYLIEDDFERLAYVAAVHLIQEKFIQIKIYKDMNILHKRPSTPDELKKIFIKPVVPFGVLTNIQ